MLPSIDDTGHYDERAYDLVRGFRVLAHAEIEAFLEDRAIAYLDHAITSFFNRGRNGKCLVSLLAYDEPYQGPPAPILNPGQKPTPDVQARVEAAKRRYSRYVRVSNHGVREENLLRLFVPLGINLQEVGATFVPVMDSWGSVRGSIAHASCGTYQPPDPLTESQTIAQVMEFMARLDDQLRAS